MDLHFQGWNSPKSSANKNPSLSGENNENDIKQDQMDSKSQNSNKPFHKHFMSPTVSASSKATVPRKKILAEKNDSAASFDVDCQKFCKLESPSGLLTPGASHYVRSSSGAFSASIPSSQFDDEEEVTSFAESSLKPYDPLTNYLSPRPQFLRYNPNRRREILDRQQSPNEKEDGSFLERSIFLESKNIVDEIKSFDRVQDSLIPPSHEGTAILQNQEAGMVENDSEDDDGNDEEEEEEEIEEFKDEKRCSLKGLLKFVLLLIVIGLSTAHMSSVNSPEPSLMQQNIMWGLRDGCCKILNHSFEAIPTNLHGDIGVMRCTESREEAQAGFRGMNQQLSYEEFGEIEMIVMDDEEALVESGDDLVKALESLNIQNSDICVTGFDKSDAISDRQSNVKTAGTLDVGSDQVDFDLLRLDIAQNIILDSEAATEDNDCDQNPAVQGVKTDAATSQELNMVEQRSQSLEEQEKMEKLDPFGDSEGNSGDDAPGNDEVDELGNNLEARKVEGISMENRGEALDNSGLEITGVTGTLEDEETNNSLISAEKAGEKMVDEGSNRPEILGDESSESSAPDYSMFEAGLKWMKARNVELGPVLTASAGSLFAVLFASLVYIYAQNATRAPSKASRPIKVNFEESKRKEKSIQVQPHVDDIECLQKKVESISLKPSSVFSLVEKTRNEHSYYNQAPKVEFPEEIVIGKVSSSMRSCGGRESKIMEAKENSKSIPTKPSSMFSSMEETRKENSYHSQAPKVELLGEFVIGKVSSSIRSSVGRESKIIEAEENSKSITHAESGARSVSPAQSSMMDTESIDSASYGSFTAEKKIRVKQGSRDGSVKIVTTPVRRSSRLQNRSVTSP